MIDELAKAINEAWAKWRAENGGDDASFCDMPDELIARAVLARLREPTEKMIDAGSERLDKIGRYHGWWPESVKQYSETDDKISKDEFRQILFDILRAMIDAAGE